jgi:hypothetical protein
MAVRAGYANNCAKEFVVINELYNMLYRYKKRKP